MERPVEKLSLRTRLLIYTLLLLLAAAIIYSDNFAGYSEGLANFSSGFAGELLFAVVIGGGVLYLHRRNYCKNRA